MSYDIYGDTLAPGHCEVHPHIPEPYPCSVCIERMRAILPEEVPSEVVDAHYRGIAMAECERRGHPRNPYPGETWEPRAQNTCLCGSVEYGIADEAIYAADAGQEMP